MIYMLYDERGVLVHTVTVTSHNPELHEPMLDRMEEVFDELGLEYILPETNEETTN